MMNQTALTLVMAQLDFLVGDVEGNTQKIVQAAVDAKQHFSADFVVFPELTLTGYPPEDLLFHDKLHESIKQAMQTLCRELPSDCAICIGHPEKVGDALYNSASIIGNGQILATHRKHHLPNYAVFDEKRYFQSGDTTTTFNLKGFNFGIVICEDAWFEGPVERVCQSGAEIVVCLNASPFHLNKTALREQMVKDRVVAGCAFVYVNLVGGQDELVFDGASFVVSKSGDVVARVKSFQESLFPITFKKNETIAIHAPPMPKPLTEIESIYQALVLGIRDYVNKNHFPGVLVGLSGGIDSALTLALAVDALGAEKCHAVLMPSVYTLNISNEDAVLEADALNVTYSILPINPAFQQILGTLAPEFSGLKEDTTEENIQARIRGILLMALSNKTGKMVLTTGNKSEMAVGYATLYGDMAGGFAPLKDVPKTLVYQLANYRNQKNRVIPERVLTRAPTAELKANQTDQDSLPDYAILDAIMQLYVEENASRASIIDAGFNAADVDLVLNRINRNEYKRRQSPPGIRISPRAFGRDWRLPITSGWKP